MCGIFPSGPVCSESANTDPVREEASPHFTNDETKALPGQVMHPSHSCTPEVESSLKCRHRKGHVFDGPGSSCYKYNADS